MLEGEPRVGAEVPHVECRKYWVDEVAGKVFCLDAVEFTGRPRRNGIPVHETTVNVRVSEMDPYGHVNHAD